MIENNIQFYEIFYHVAKVGNITKTADMLFITQPAVTQSIHKLEDILGGKLFIRSKRGVTLTPEGKDLYNYISPYIEGLHNAKNKFSQFFNLDIGEINIGCGTTLSNHILLPVIKKFSNDFPNIHINIRHDLNPQLEDNLKYGKIDIMIYNMPYHFNNEFYNESFKIVQDCFGCSKEYFKKINSKISLSELNNYSLILQQNPSSKRKFLDNLCSKYDVVLNPKYELSSMTLVENFVKNSLGIGFLNKNQIENNDSLIEIPLKENIPSRQIGYAVKKEELISNAVKEFIEYLKKY